MSEKTVHKSSTPHGLRTPHKYPSALSDELDVLNDLSVQLYPTGRAWYKPEGGTFENFHRAINVSFARYIQELETLINGTFPDNDKFTKKDALLWEYRLGLITNENIDLEIRKKALLRKIGHPNNIRARQNGNFIESQLRLLGFDVFVHENTIPYKNPSRILAENLLELQHEDSVQHGNSTQHGSGNFSVVANSIEEVESYAVGDDNLRATFFIGGATLGEYATVPRERLREFKELVIKLKPAHLVAFTFINYL